jgi:hypothetical protein
MYHLFSTDQSVAQEAGKILMKFYFHSHHNGGNWVVEIKNLRVMTEVRGRMGSGL